MMGRFVRAAGVAGVGLCAVASPRSGSAQAPKTEPGFDFDVAVTINVGGAMSGTLSSMGPGYTGHGVALGSRVRIDIVEGALPPLVEKGDYMLFDSTGITVVHPAKKEFLPLSAEVSSKALEQLQALGMSISVKDIDVKLDTIAGDDTIAGFKARHYRTAISYTLALDGFGTSQQLKSSATAEYWMASIAGMSTSPLQRTGQLSGGQGLGLSKDGALKDLAVKIDSVSHLMKGTAVRVKSTTTSDTGGGSMSIELGSQMLRVKPSPVDAALFVVPADYTRGALPGSGNN